MKIDCQWFESHLEAYFSETMGEEDGRGALAHLEACPACTQQVQSIQNMDPLVRQLMRHRFAQARQASGRRPQLRLLRPVLLGTAIAAILAVPFVLKDKPQGVPPTIVVEQQDPPQPSTEPDVFKKKSSENPVERSKPDEGVEAPLPHPISPEDDPVRGGLDFAVIDAAGYSTTLDNYRGLILIVGVWSSGQSEAAESLNRIYETFGHKSQVRVLGVAAQRQDKLDGTMFPVVYNRGSQLMGLKTGEFVLLDKSGNRRLSGSLMKGANTPVALIKTQIDQLGAK